MASYRGSAVAPGMLLLSLRPFESDAFHINLVPRAFPSEIGRGGSLSEQSCHKASSANFGKKRLDYELLVL